VYWLGIYARLRNDTAFTKMYMNEVKVTAAVTILGLLGAWAAPRDDIIEFVLSQGKSSLPLLMLAFYSAFAVCFLVSPAPPAIASRKLLKER